MCDIWGSYNDAAKDSSVLAHYVTMSHQLLNAVVTVVISKEHIGSILGIKKSKKRDVNSSILKVAIWHGARHSLGFQKISNTEYI